MVCSGLVASGGVLDSYLWDGNMLDSDLLSRAVIGSRLLGTNMACKFLTGGCVICSGLVASDGMLDLCLGDGNVLDSGLLSSAKISSCLLAPTWLAGA